MTTSLYNTILRRNKQRRRRWRLRRLPFERTRIEYWPVRHADERGESSAREHTIDSGGKGLRVITVRKTYQRRDNDNDLIDPLTHTLTMIVHTIIVDKRKEFMNLEHEFRARRALIIIRFQ